MGIGSKIEVSNPQSQYEFDRWIASRVVCGFATTPLKERAIATKGNNSGKGLGDFHETT